MGSVLIFQLKCADVPGIRLPFGYNLLQKSIEIENFAWVWEGSLSLSFSPANALRDGPLEKWWGVGKKPKKNSWKGKCQEKNSCKEEGKEKKIMQKEGPIVTFLESLSFFQKVWVSEINNITRHNMNKQKSLSSYWKETIRTLFLF